MQLIHTRTETFRSSFFPSSFRLWNELDQSVKNVDSLSSFKSKLKKKTTPHNPYHDLCCRTAFHFFHECLLYTIFRNDLQMETMFLPNLSLNITLNGDVDSSAQRNSGIHSAVSKYIIKTNRF